jgi:hypothetical protein
MPQDSAADHPGFRHRPESIGIVASICLKCFATVARTKSEDDLAQFERAHVCNGYDRERFRDAKTATRESN